MVSIVSYHLTPPKAAKNTAERFELCARNSFISPTIHLHTNSLHLNSPSLVFDKDIFIENRRSRTQGNRMITTEGFQTTSEDPISQNDPLQT